MAKELTHRAEELKELGWSQDDVLRYAELWDYRQRWGSINLEREDRQFLKKAEAALPKLVSGKVSAKKPLQEKSYYLWIRFYVQEMEKAERGFDLDKGSAGLWRLILEEELRVLDYYEPVLGLPDTIKARALFGLREELIKDGLEKHKNLVELHNFDFLKPINDLKSQDAKTSWKYLREGENSENRDYFVLKEESVSTFRKQIREKLPSLIVSLLPSLSETEKPLPPDNWSRE